VKLNVWTEGPVEVVADVSFEDVLSHLAGIVEDGESCPNRLVGAIDWLTRIFKAVDDTWIRRMTPEIRAEIAKRLSSQAERYRVA
jgi:hypothetical protein